MKHLVCNGGFLIESTLKALHVIGHSSNSSYFRKQIEAHLLWPLNEPQDVKTPVHIQCLSTNCHSERIL